MSESERKQGPDRGRDADRAAEAEAEAANDQAQNFRMRVMARRWIQRKASRSAGTIGELPKASMPLPADTRARMEPQLGADLSSVKIGTDGSSAAAAEQLGARAFTADGEVHFGAGQFAPGTKEGDRLLAHELTHVVQGQKSGVQRKAEPDEGGAGEHGAEVSHPDEPAEKEADAVADHVADKLHGDDKGSKSDKKHGAGAKDDAGEKGAGEKGAGEHTDGGGKEGAAGGQPAAIGAGPGAGVRRKVSRSAKPGAPQITAAPPTIGAKIFRKWIEFKDLPATQKGPTTDPNHPHLKEMGIKSLGPYKYFPAKGEFQYTAPADLKDLWADTEDGKTYDPEAPAAPQAQAKAADKKARQAAAKKKFGPGLDAILAHDDGKTPRPFTSVVDEDTRGAALDAHNVQRHCVSAASDMKSKQDVALRAGFGMIGGAVKGVYTATASAFESVAAANTAIAPPLNKQMTSNWADWRTQLAAGKNAFSPVIGAGGSGAIIFKSVSGAPLNVDQVPKYLGLDPSHKGISPLWPGDDRWQKWWDTHPQERKDYEKANGPNAKPPAITTDVSSTATGVSMRVLPEPTLTNGGWILHSAYPTT